jgi:hypothetical protein
LKPAQLSQSNSHRQGRVTTSLPNSTQAPITAGIEVAKAGLEIAVYVSSPPLSLPNDEEGFDALLMQLQAHQVALVLMEATDGLETAAAWALQAWPSSARSSSVTPNVTHLPNQCLLTSSNC